MRLKLCWKPCAGSPARREFISPFCTAADEGISGTNTKHRDGFNEMVADALAGKIDLIVTKSVSRFARNTVDSLTTVRKLKEHGCEVFFEKENIYTFDSKGELLITIMSSLAQEESRSISENVTWGQRKRFADGKVSLPYKHFLGYRKGENGLPEIVPEQAVIVKQIYAMFISGKTPFAIAKTLSEEGIPSPSGKPKWISTTVDSILTNEKYKGDALLQKGFTVDFLTKKKNEGEVPQYYVENSHPYIIDPREWDMVQTEFARRKALGRKYSGNSVLSSRVICGDCGDFYGPKVWHSNDPYRRVVWRCNHKYEDGKRCNTPTLDEETIKARFLDAFNALVSNKERIFADCRTIQSCLTDCTSIDAEIDTLVAEVDVVRELTERYIEENSRNVQDQASYLARYNSLVERYETAKARIEALQGKKAQRQQKADLIGGFMFELHERDEMVTEFSNRLWYSTIDTVTVHSDGHLVYKFLNGMEIET